MKQVGEVGFVDQMLNKEMQLSDVPCKVCGILLPKDFMGSCPKCEKLLDDMRIP